MNTTHLQSDANNTVHRWAWLLLCATFVLIVVGGIVTTTDSGMAFKDWMTSDGTFFLVYNWFASSGDKFIEHGHRLLGSLAGFLAIGLVAVAHWKEPRPWVRKFSWLILAGVILQGVLGGARVVFDERVIALVHGCVGPLFFTMVVAMVVVTSRWWREPTTQAAGLAQKKTFRLAAVCACLVYAQLVVGAVLRHSPDLTGQLSATIFRVAVYFHVLLALMIVGHVLLLAFRCLRTRLQRSGGLALLALVISQVFLGIGSWLVKYGMPLWATQFFGQSTFVNRRADVLSSAIVTGHMAVGSLILVVSVAMALRLGRQLGIKIPLLMATKSSGKKSNIEKPHRMEATP